MKNIIFLLTLILLLPVIFAETQIFSGEVITDSDKIIDEGLFRFRYDGIANKVLVQTPTTNLIVDNGACKSNGVFRVCINKANFSYKNITTYVYYYEIDATIYKLTGSLSATTKITPDTLLQNEPAEFKITITNPTDFEIINILFNYTLLDFSIKEVKGCSFDGAKMTWQGSLQSKYDKVCTAAIITEKEGKFDLAGDLSYFNGFETEKKLTDTVAVTVLPKQLKVIQVADKDVEVKQPFYLNVSLENIHEDETIESAVTIELPSNIALLKGTQRFNKEFNVLRRSLILETSSAFNYSLYLEASSEGNIPIKQTFDYTIKGIRDVIENNTFINPVEPKPIVNISAEYGEVMPGQKFIVVAKLKNPSRIHDLRDIKAKLNAPSGEIEQSLNKLVPDEAYTIISNILTMPEQFAEETAKLNLNIEYNFDGEIKLLNKSLELKIKQANETVTAATESAQQTKAEGTAEAQPKLSNETEVATITEKPSLFNKKILFIGALVLTAFLAVMLVAFKRKKRKSGQMEQEALKEIQEKILKSDGQKPKTKDF